MASGKGKDGNGRPKGGAPANGGREGALERFARDMAAAAGRPGAFLLAAAAVTVWALSGPIFGFSNSWQLVINTGTTIVTFLMVFLIQRAQNRDTMALQAKLGELIIAVRGAKNELATAEDFSEHELERLHDLHSKKAQRRPERMADACAATGAGNHKAPLGANSRDMK